MKDAYQRRRTKARVEKSARLKKLPVITLEFAKKVIEDETGAPVQLGDDRLASRASSPFSDSRRS